MAEGGCVVDHHGCDFFPERWGGLFVAWPWRGVAGPRSSCAVAVEGMSVRVGHQRFRLAPLRGLVSMCGRRCWRLWGSGGWARDLDTHNATKCPCILGISCDLSYTGGSTWSLYCKPTTRSCTTGYKSGGWRLAAVTTSDILAVSVQLGVAAAGGCTTGRRRACLGGGADGWT